MSSLQPGSVISHYRIKELIASGGMGEVYKAVDLRLGRVVALKVPSPDLIGNLKAHQRFMREARAASLLSHPGICTIFEVGQEGELCFIVMEYVEGRTIKDWIASAPLPEATALGFALQVTDALQEAHRRGIVHRDLKPSNIIINQRGLAVVLDFGLAKRLQTPDASDEDSPTLSQAVITTEATIIGTVAYMSPEQVRGREVDARSDIFALGVLLYEMVSGQRPFQGEGNIEVMQAILHEEPPPVSSLRPGVSREVEAIIGQALRKNPDERYQTAAELKSALWRLTREQGSTESEALTASFRTRMGPMTAAPSPTRWPWLRHPLMWWLVIAALGVSIWLYVRRPAPSEAELLTSLRTVSLASWKGEPGDEMISRARFSPDGKFVVFTSSRGGERDLWLRQIQGEEPLPITKDRWVEANPIWSPDGQRIAFTSTRGDQRGIWAIPALGGTPTLLKAFEERAPTLISWSRDGAVIYCGWEGNLWALELASTQFTQVTHLESSLWQRHFSLSPDETQLAYIDARDGKYGVWVMARGGGQPRQVTENAARDEMPIWHPDGRRIIYSSSRAGITQICVAYLDGRPPLQLTYGEGDSTAVDVSADGRRILSSTSKDEADLWGTQLGTQREFQVTADIGLELWPEIAPDGRTLAFQAVGSADPKLKLFNYPILAQSLAATGKEQSASSPSAPRRLTASGFDPQWSPDGGTLAFLRFAAGRVNLWTVSVTGGAEQQLTREGIFQSGFQYLPYDRLETRDYHWSPDGQRLAYCALRDKVSNVWTVAADGSSQTQLTGNLKPELRYSCPLWSPDGARLAFVSFEGRSREDRTWQVWVAERGKTELIFSSRSVLRLMGWARSGRELIVRVLPGRNLPLLAAPTEVSLVKVGAGTEQPLARLAETYFSNMPLAPDGRWVAFVSRQGGENRIGVLPAEGGAVRWVARQPDPRVYFFSLTWAPDGQTLYYGQQVNWRVVSMLDNFR
jgi:Tol biopolymer transport system component/serine/threonine protein kinase